MIFEFANSINYRHGVPFSSVNVPDYDPNAERLTIISAPGADVLSISPYNSRETQLYHDEIQEDTYQYPVILPTPLILQEIQPIQEVLEKHLAFSTRELHIPEQEPLPTLRESKKQDAFVGKLLAIEVLCPNCGESCTDPKTGSLMITQDLIGHTVHCVECHTESLVPLNAFSLTTDVVAREKPTTSGPHNKNDKKGRTQKEHKSTRGRKAKSGVVRQPRQLSLDVRTIQTLDAMGANNSQLFETLLNQYEPFLDTWAELGYASSQEEDDE